ncbi:MAG: hypothetical protein IPL54_00110 [Chitinophagaceae bacterium]|nr:hypothetical protein [Chitinophagaceae bacterium]
MAQLPPTVRVKGIRLMVQIKGGGAIICSNNSAGGYRLMSLPHEHLQPMN